MHDALATPLKGKVETGSSSKLIRAGTLKLGVNSFLSLSNTSALTFQSLLRFQGRGENIYIILSWAGLGWASAIVFFSFLEGRKEEHRGEEKRREAK